MGVGKGTHSKMLGQEAHDPLEAIDTAPTAHVSVYCLYFASFLFLSIFSLLHGTQVGKGLLSSPNWLHSEV